MLLLLISLVAMGMGVMGADPEPAKCCMDKEYTTTIGQIGAWADLPHNTEVLIDGYLQMGFDFYRRRQGYINNLKQPDGSYVQMYQMKDYATGLQYDQTNNGTCTVTRIPPSDQIFPPCIPDSARYLGPSVIGFGAHTLNVNTWEFFVPLPLNTTFVMSVTRDFCVPVVQRFSASAGGTPYEVTQFYTDYKPGIEDVNFLDAPSNCDSLPIVILGRR